MTDALVRHEAAVRLGAFVTVLGVMAVWEALAARRGSTEPPLRRRGANLCVALLNGALARVVPAASAVAAARAAESAGWGLLAATGLPLPLVVAFSVVLLDLALYVQHVLFHAVPLLWRLHRVHHSDRDFDVTTGVRFHPVEILLSAFYKAGVVAALGPPVAAVVLFEVLLNAASLFNHGNVRIPLRLDRALRWAVVTPDMHRVHHSVDPAETDSNFGFSAPWWDRLFGTYRAQPAQGHERMEVGVRDLRAGTVWRMLLLPFRPDGPPSGR